MSADAYSNTVIQFQKSKISMGHNIMYLYIIIYLKTTLYLVFFSKKNCITVYCMHLHYMRCCSSTNFVKILEFFYIAEPP